MKEFTHTAPTAYSARLPMTKRLHKPNVAQQAKKKLQKDVEIPEGYVTLEEFMTNLLNALDQHYAGKEDNR